MRSLILIITIGFLFIHSHRLISAEEEGGYAGSFLEWGAGARAIALGKTFTAISDDGTALLWNPAGLAQLSTKELIAMHAIIFEDRSVNYVAGALPVGKLGFSAGWLRFAVSDIQERDDFGQLLGKFNDAENVFLTGGGIKLLSNSLVSIKSGLNFRYYYHSLYKYHASGVGIDAGILSVFRLSGVVKRIAVGAVIQNLGASLKWNTESDRKENIPRVLRLGSDVSIKMLPLHLVVDLEAKQNLGMRYHVGVEYWIKMLALRAGLNHDRLSAGAGIVLKLSDFGFIVDYAICSDEVANQPLHFFTLSLRFL